MQRLYKFSTFLSLLALVCALACTDRKPNQAIVDATHLIDQDAKRAASILEGIDPQLLSPEDRAKYGIVLSMAYERIDRKIKSDSIIAPSLRYYRDKDDMAQRAKSLYFYGKVMENKGAVKRATESFLEVISTLEPTPKDSVLSRLKATTLHNLAALYYEQDYIGEALKYYQRSAKTFDLISKKEASKIRYMEANAYTRLGQTEKGMAMLDSLYLTTTDPEFKLWIKLTTLSKFILEDKGTYSLEKLSEMHRQIDLDVLQATPNSGEWSAPPIFMYNTITAFLAYRKGEAQEAYRYMQLGLKDLGDITPLNVGYYVSASEIAKAAGRMGEALAFLKTYASKKDSLNTILKEQQIKQVETAYHDKKNGEMAFLKMRYQLYLLAILSALILLASLMAMKLYKRRIAMQRKEIEAYLTLTESYKQSNNSITEKLKESDLRERTIKDYLASRKDMVQQIAQTYYTYGDGKLFAEKMRDTALSEQMLKDLVEITDLHVEGAISRLKETFPHWTPKNYNFVSLLIAGFSPQEISVMLSMTLGGVYTLKSKLKSKILQSEQGNASEFLKFF